MFEMKVVFFGYWCVYASLSIFSQDGVSWSTGENSKACQTDLIKNFDASKESWLDCQFIQILFYESYDQFYSNNHCGTGKESLRIDRGIQIQFNTYNDMVKVSVLAVIIDEYVLQTCSTASIIVNLRNNTQMNDLIGNNSSDSSNLDMYNSIIAEIILISNINGVTQILYGILEFLKSHKNDNGSNDTIYGNENTDDDQVDSLIEYVSSVEGKSNATVSVLSVVPKNTIVNLGWFNGNSDTTYNFLSLVETIDHVMVMVVDVISSTNKLPIFSIISIIINSSDITQWNELICSLISDVHDELKTYINLLSTINIIIQMTNFTTIFTIRRFSTYVHLSQWKFHQLSSNVIGKHDLISDC